MGAMMSEPKPLASLTSGLLARKGGAKPAMRRQMAIGHDPAAQDDLGWNDMGYDVDPAYQDDAPQHHHAGLTPMVDLSGPAAVHVLPGVDVQDVAAVAAEPEVVQQHRRVQALAAPVSAPAATPKPAKARQSRPRAEVGANGRFAFTLRLDGQRHLMLRLASAATNQSAQQILIKLVDDYFGNQPAVAAMAAQLGSAHAEGKEA
jgi:hypothetical protein